MSHLHRIPPSLGPLRAVFLTAIICLGSLYLFGTPTHLAIATTACVFGFCVTKRDFQKRPAQDQSLRWW